MTEILPRLWLGSDKTLNNDFLKTHNIKFIINCSKDIPDNSLNIETIRVNVDDKPNISHAIDNKIMLESLPSLVHYIHKFINNNKNVLVHCKAGKQRSACVVCAYIIKYGEVDIDKAVYYIRTKRPIAFTPVVNFLPALQHYKTTL